MILSTVSTKALTRADLEILSLLKETAVMPSRTMELESTITWIVGAKVGAALEGAYVVGVAEGYMVGNVVGVKVGEVGATVVGALVG